MNSDQLDQNSINSLFDDVHDPQNGLPLDFSARQSLTPEQLKILTALNQPIMQTLTFQLSAWLGADVTCSMLAVERQLYRSFLSSQDLQSLHFTRGNFAAMRAPALLCVDYSCMDPVAHYGLGGTLAYVNCDANRGATANDMALLDSLLTKVWSEVNQIWASCNVSADFEESVLPTSLPKIFSPSDNLLVFTYVLTIACVESSLQLCLPSTIADRLLHELHREDSKSVQPPEVKQLLLQRLGETRHTGTLRLPAFSVPLSRLNGLKAGDLLDTGIAVSTPAEFLIAGGPVWESRPVKFERGHRAAQIVTPQRGEVSH